MKKVWIVAPFSNIKMVGVRNRFQYLANRLHNEGMDVTLFTSDFRHGKKTHVSSDIVKEYPFKVKLIHEPGYEKNVSVKRALSHKRFGDNLKKQIEKIEEPDIIYAAYPTMSSSYIAGKYAKENDIPFIIDIQDTWPESVSSAIDTKKLIVRILMWPFTKFANKIYRMADVVFGVSETYAQRANVKGTNCKEFIPVYIGAELEKFDNVNYDEGEIRKSQDDIWITYIGTLSHSYDIGTAVKAFAEINENKNIKLNIIGSGPDEDKLIKLAKELGIYNQSVYFHGFMKYEDMIVFLKKSDIALNALTAGSKGTITNKLGDYVSAGLPILNSSQEQEVIDLVNNKELGINYTPGDVSSLKNAILKMIEDKESMKKYSRNSRLLAEKYFDRKESYKVIVDKIREFI
ncbi:glycosyltransferase family 4 protein [Anaerosalibacter bizertensis]|uniref:glycosyltransferase family 4 protein n=1 Tax=Anaerosalibacter bizertensis TaxID=932217 RepID=UPI001C0EA799|nr:glycosyltransferase family 4 protein [Anaerosalibacter bizertensis]MBU5294112.1 glycosyltransferase family 4 protein [Anaerosalibacter bizertensis]